MSIVLYGPSLALNAGNTKQELKTSLKITTGQTCSVYRQFIINSIYLG